MHDRREPRFDIMSSRPKASMALGESMNEPATVVTIASVSLILNPAKDLRHVPIV
jgi:hypothetical protein